MNSTFSFDGFGFDDKSKAEPAALDLFSFHTTNDNIVAPHPDLFESEIDLSLAALVDPAALQIPVIDQDPLNTQVSFFKI